MAVGANSVLGCDRPIRSVRLQPDAFDASGSSRTLHRTHVRLDGSPRIHEESSTSVRFSLDVLLLLLRAGGVLLRVYQADDRPVRGPLR
jgi:hypothetical protein